MSSNVKVAVVTGAASGIGLAIAERMAKTGHEVVLIDKSEKVQEVAARLKSEGGKTWSQVVDLADSDALPGVVGAIGDRYGRLDILVNNAGIHPKKNGMPYLIEEMSTEQWNLVINVNMTSVFVLSREAFRLMKPKKFGRIINITSRASRMHSSEAGAHYHASKTGVVGLTRVLAGEFGPYGVTANCVAPGRVRTPLSAEGVGEQHNAKYAANYPVRRVGVTTEIAAAVEYLASDEAGYTTGAIIDVNGGGFMP